MATKYSQNLVENILECRYSLNYPSRTISGAAYPSGVYRFPLTDSERSFDVSPFDQYEFNSFLIRIVSRVQMSVSGPSYYCNPLTQLLLWQLEDDSSVAGLQKISDLSDDVLFRTQTLGSQFYFSSNITHYWQYEGLPAGISISATAAAPFQDIIIQGFLK